MDFLKEVQRLDKEIEQKATGDPEMDKIRDKIESNPQIKDLIKQSLEHQLKLKNKQKSTF
ncbi:MAG: hypothetical protein QNJ54_25515 [Prochloraceae cyanobacterium]|nr:hypothetical protein [Prochloraceae cyanobacterium]